MIYDQRACFLGEGPLWHPIREQLFWFDIVNCKLLSQREGNALEWAFDEMVSAAGWIDENRLLIASESRLFTFDLTSGQQDALCPLEQDNHQTRSNDGRADPQGGFWIGTMGKSTEPGAGSIWRYFRGELRCIFKNITISNAICFAPDGHTAHFTDTATGRVMRVALDVQGWPKGAPETHLDLTAEGLHPDGAVIDAQGVMWLAQWGAARVAAYAPDGAFLRAITFDAPHTSCPAFGGDTLFCTTALQGMGDAARAAYPHAGKTFAAKGVAKGQCEHQVII
jgi:sugar lactone lactonase YvrE